MEDRIWIEALVAIGTISTPILVLVFGAMIRRHQQSLERKVRAEEHLQDDRIKIYNEILEPYVMMLMPDRAWKSDPKNRKKDKFQTANSKILSLEYRMASSRLSLIGSDEVVRAFNNLMQYFFNRDDATPVTDKDVRDMMALFGNLLLEIRRSTGNEATALDNWSMLEWFIVDAQKLRRDDQEFD